MLGFTLGENAQQSSTLATQQAAEMFENSEVQGQNTIRTAKNTKRIAQELQLAFLKASLLGIMKRLLISRLSPTLNILKTKLNIFKTTALLSVCTAVPKQEKLTNPLPTLRSVT